MGQLGTLFRHLSNIFFSTIVLTIEINPLFFINGYRGYKVILNALEIFIMKDKSPIETDIKTTEAKKRVSTNQKKYPARI